MTNNKKLFYVLLLLPLLFIMVIAQPTAAQPANVLDCLENEEDCEEDESEIAELNESDSEVDLVGNDSFKASTLFFNIIKMVVALFFILALIYIILLVLRRRNRLLHNHDLLENLGGISLGQNKSLQIIRIGSHIYVVGVGDHVDLMLEITEQDVLEKLLTMENTNEEIPFIQTLFSRRNNKTEPKDDFMSQLDDELNKLQKNRERLVHKAVEKDDEHV